MKLTTTAVAALVSSAVDAASSPMQATATVRASSSLLHDAATSFGLFSSSNNNNNKIRHLQQQQRGRRARGKGLLSDGVGRRRQLVNNNNNNALRPGLTECSPDLGILACGGLNEYCIASVESTFGGFCMDLSDRLQRGSNNNSRNKDVVMRSLQDDEEVTEPTMSPMDEEEEDKQVIGSPQYCSCYGPSYNATNQWERSYYYYCKQDPTYSYRACTCSNVDREAYTLTAVCNSKPREGCYTAYSNCGANYTKCYDEDDTPQNSLTLDITDEGSFSREDCNQMDGMEVCSGRSISFTPSTPENPYGTYSVESCSRKVNGVTCNSCEIVMSLYDPCAQPFYLENPQYNCSAFNITCYEFDCENTDWKKKGSTCDPYEYVYEPRAYGCDLECKICGADANMTLPDAMLTIPFYWNEMSCAESQRRAEQGSLTSEGCAAMNILASETCGCEATVRQSNIPKEGKKGNGGGGGGVRSQASAEAVLASEDTLGVPAAGANWVATGGLALTVATAAAWLVAY
jgi:hypothetical protein